MQSTQGHAAAFPALLVALALAAVQTACEPATQEDLEDAAESVAAEAETTASEAGAAAEQAVRDAEAEIMELEREWSRRAGQGDIEWIVGRHAQNARAMPPNAEPVVGREAIRAFWSEMMATEGLSVSWEPTEAHVSTSGDMAYDVGTYEMTLPDGSTDRGKYLVVWVREGGEWRIAADMFSSDQPPPGGAG